MKDCCANCAHWNMSMIRVDIRGAIIPMSPGFAWCNRHGNTFSAQSLACPKFTGLDELEPQLEPEVLGLHPGEPT